MNPVEAELSASVLGPLGPADLEPGEWVLGLRWDCEKSAQVWQSCADVTITA